MVRRISESEDLVDVLIGIWAEVSRSGDAMPSEPQLAARTGSSRATIREALIRLEERGYIYRSHGARTVINSRLGDVGSRVDQQRDHLEAISRAGYEPGLVVLSAAFDVIAAPRVDSEAPFHDLAPGTPVLRTRKVWSADGQPYVLADDIVPIVGGRPGRLGVDLDPSEPVFDLAERLNGVAVAWETVWFSSAALAAHEQAALELADARPVLVLTYCGVGAGDDVAYWCREVQITAPAHLRNVLVRRVSRG